MDIGCNCFGVAAAAKVPVKRYNLLVPAIYPTIEPSYEKPFNLHTEKALKKLVEYLEKNEHRVPKVCTPQISNLAFTADNLLQNVVPLSGFTASRSKAIQRCTIETLGIRSHHCYGIHPPHASKRRSARSGVRNWARRSHSCKSLSALSLFDVCITFLCLNQVYKLIEPIPPV